MEKANLNSSQARLPAARAKFERYKNLYQKNSISRDQLDDAEASYRSLEADIDSLKATIARREVRAPSAVPWACATSSSASIWNRVPRLCAWKTPA